MINEVVDIVLVNYNGYKDTIECIESIFHSIYKNVNIIIVDNHSTDNSIEEIKKIKMNCFNYVMVTYDSKNKKYNYNSKKNHYNNVVLISSDKNGGFGYANNVAFEFSKRYLKSSYCWILNNDTIVDKNAISNLVNMIKLNKNVMIGATIIEYYNKKVIQRIAGNYYYPFFGFVKSFNKSKKIQDLDKIKPKFNYLTGCSIFTSYKVINEIGGFDERYFLYSEDKDLCKSAEKKKIKLVWCKNAIIYHKGGNSIGTKNSIRESSDLSEYNTNYSTFLFNKKWYKLYKIYSFNRYILKVSKFKINKNYNKVNIVKNAYKDYKELVLNGKK